MHTMASTLPEDLQDVLQFVEECGGFFPSSKCEVRPSDVGGLGVYALCDIKQDETLLQLPKTCVFSASNSSIANLLVDSEVDGMLALSLAFIYETSVFKERSHWYPYLKSVKTTGDGHLYLPPNLWSPRSKRVLKGSTLDTLHHGLDPEEEVQQGYKFALELTEHWNREFGLCIPSQHLSSFEQFVAVVYAISSRAFEVDNYHESALVPIADLFNHHGNGSCSHVRFVSLYDVCGECGEPGMCRHLVAEAVHQKVKEEPADNEQTPSHGVIDMQVIQELEGQEDEPSEEQEESLVRGVHPDDCVDVVVTRDVPKGQEIFNSYGELSNAMLLARYSFCVKENPWDVVYLGRDLSKLLKDKTLSKRTEWWDRLGYKLYRNWCALNKDDEDEDEDDEDDEDEDDDDDDEEHGQNVQCWLSEMCIDHQGHPSSSMRAFLNLLSMNPHDWNTLRSIEQDAESQGSKIAILDKPLGRRSSKMLIRLVSARQARQPPLADVKNLSARLMLESEQDILHRAQSRLEKDAAL